MKSLWTRAVRSLAWVLAVVFVIGMLIVLKLALPGQPKSTATMRFDGFIKLPKGPTLSVLDYMSVFDGSMFVTNESNGAVFKVDLPEVQNSSMKVSTFAGDGLAHGVVIDPVSQLGFVTRSGANVVDVFDPRTLTLSKHIPVADDADAILYDPSSRLIYVAHGDAHLVTLIDPRLQEPVRSIPLSGKAEYAAYDPQVKLVYQTINDRNKVAVIDTNLKTVVAEWPLSECEGPTPMAIDAKNRKLFIGCSGNARFVVLDLDTHGIVASIKVGASPDAIAYDLGLSRLYVTGKAGVLSIIQQDAPSTYRLLDSIEMHYGAHTLTVNPATHKVYVGYASLFVTNRIAVFTPR